MSILLDLPKDPKERALSINWALSGALRTRNIHSVEWWMVHYYLQGARKFQVLDWNQGTVRVAFESQTGELDFRWEDVVIQYQAELGRLNRIDVNPATSSEGLSLDAMRGAGVSKAFLDAQVAGMGLESVKSRYTQMLIKYGTVGLAVWRQDRPAPKGGESIIEYEYEVVPPWQLLSIPDSPPTLEDVRAIVRSREVPLRWLRNLPQFKLPADDDPILKIRRVPLGQVRGSRGPQSGVLDPSIIGSNDPMTPRPGGPDLKGETRGYESVVTLHEIFVQGPEETCAAYHAVVGDHLAADHNYWAAGEKRVCPIAVGRYTPTDSFYGRGFLSRLVGLNHEVEKMLRNLFENVQDMDEFGFVMCPNNLGVNKRAFKKTSKPRIIFYGADYTLPESKPYTLEPATTGDFPGRVASMGTQLQQKLSGQSELLSGSAPGRTDSAAAMGFLFETSNIPLSVPAEEIRRVWSHAHRALLQMGREDHKEGDVIHLRSVDDSIAGVILDPVSGSMKLDSNILPDAWDVKVGIQESMPQPKAQRKAELIQMLQLQLVTPLEFRIINYREELGFPVGNRAEWSGYQKAMYHNILLFGDGATPGTIVSDNKFDNPEIQLFALQDFVAKVQFSLASNEVQEAFEQRITYFQSLTGSYPEQLPLPEEAAELALGAEGAGAPAPGALEEAQGEPAG